MSEKSIAALILELKASIAKTHDLATQIQHLAAGENPTRDTIAFWCDEWKKRHGSPYAVTKADAGQVKRLVGVYGAAEVKARIVRYLRDDDVFLVQRKHLLSIFVKTVPSYTPLAAGDSDDDEPPADCRHIPTCRTDAEHTRRRADEMKRA